MSLEKSETFEPIEINKAPEAAPEPVTQVQQETPRKRYAPPSAPRVMKFMSSVKA
jgi:hypothetical protein